MIATIRHRAAFPAAGGSAGEAVGWRPIAGFIAVYAALVLALSLIVTPFDGMDEAAHFLRVTSIANGYVLPIAPPRTDPRGWTSRGGRVDRAALALARHVDVGGGRRFPHVTAAGLRARLARPAAGQPIYAIHSNTAIYSPVAYMPQALAVAVAERIGATPLLWLYAARFAGALGFCVLLAAAMVACRAMAPVLSVAAVLPMVPYQAAVLTSDTAVLGCSLVMAACLGAVMRHGGLDRWRGVLLVGATVVVCSGKLAYLGLAAVPVVVGFRYGDRSARRYAVAGAAASVLAFAAWTLAIRHHVVPVRYDIAADPARQLGWIAAHPAAAARVLVTSAAMDLPFLVISMGGRVLGQDDLLVPLKILLPLLAIVLGAIGSAAAVRRNRPALVAMVAVSLASYLAIEAMLFLQWTVVGAARVDGVQGRYLLPFLFILLALPRAGPTLPAARRLLPLVALFAALPIWEAYRCYWL